MKSFILTNLSIYSILPQSINQVILVAALDPVIQCKRLAVYSISSLIQARYVGEGSDLLCTKSGTVTVLDELLEIGCVFILLCDAGTMILVKPFDESEKGLVFDTSGEPALLSEVFDCHPEINWKEHKDLMQMLIQVEPSIPFDRNMSDEEPYLVALKQYPAILHEDRVLPKAFSHLNFFSAMDA